MNRKKYDDIISITERWQMYLTGGYTLAQAIEFCINDIKAKKQLNCLEYMLLDLEKGIGAENAIERCRPLFPDFYIHMFKMGVNKGKLLEILGLLQEYYQQRKNYGREIENKLYYPLITFSVFIGICFISTAVFLPRILGIFNQLDLELPWLTSKFIAITNIVFQPVFLSFMFISVLGLIVLGKKFSLTPALDKMLLNNFPFFKNFFLYKTLKSFLLALKISLSAGGEITNCLKQAAEISGSSYFKARITEVIVDINIGKPLTPSLVKWLIIPENLQYILKGGEETGKMIEAIDFCAEFCKHREEEFLQKVSINLEPAIILFLAVLVTLLSLALLMPLWDMYGNIIQF